MSRPRYHLTSSSGHVNDPLGVTWWDGRYHLFFQLNPHAATWALPCHWGHVDGRDLMHWQHPHVALAPDGAGGPDEGCWSGAVVVADGVPTMLYTSVSAAAPALGRIAVAHGDAGLRHWVKGGTVVDGPPAGLGVTVFRDPQVARVGGGWRMVVGAGLAGGVAAVLQYSSPDLRAWTFDGVLCRRPGSEHDPVWTGTAWECPQLFELDGSWVLVVSVWDDDVTRYVAYAVGDYDGTVFTPRAWHRFAHGDSAYATTCFADADGRRCAISWSRDGGPAGERAWAGALTVPHVLGLAADGRLTVAPHPDVDGLRGAMIADVAATRVRDRPLAVDGVPEQADIRLAVRLPARDDHVAVALAPTGGAAALLRLGLDRRTGEASLERPGRSAETMPIDTAGDGRVDVRVLLDADVAEVFTGTGRTATVRTAVRSGPARLTLTGSAGTRVEALTVHAMKPCLPP